MCDCCDPTSPSPDPVVVRLERDNEELRQRLAAAEAACLAAYRAWVQQSGSSQFVKDEAAHLLIDVVRPTAKGGRDESIR